MIVLQILFALLAGLVLLQLIYPFCSMLLATVLGRERLGRHPQAAPRDHDYACIITAYKNAEIARPLVDSLLRQDYGGAFTVYLIADECAPVDFGIHDPRFAALYPDPPLRLKVKSILHALEHFQRPHAYIAVFDADNLAHPGFLKEINRYANAGHRCIQGQRRAKNLDTTYAALDSMGEHYKNHIERYVPYLLGGSAVISGSGMATEAGLYRAYLASPEIEQGKHQWKKMLQEDKILQNFVLRQPGGRIAYARQAIVYDEKVETGAAVETQRSRWLFSYFQNLPNASGLLLRGLLGLNFNRAYFGFVTLVLPMFIQLAAAAALVLLGLWLAPLWSLLLLAGMGVFALGILWALWRDGAPKPVWDALWRVPFFVLRQARSLLKMGNPNKNFRHTEHRKYVSVDEVLGKPPAGGPQKEDGEKLGV
jgi:cellulose synthase/poly-beta-1,6-N-acetylglucosamine synthase-like glycosyltransferase